MKTLIRLIAPSPILLVSSLSSAQVEKLPTADAVQVVVERHHGLTEDFTEDVSALSNIVHVVARHADGTVFADTITHNLRTCGGLDWQANSMSATSGRPAAANFIALTNDGTAPPIGDCAPGSTACTLTSTPNVTRHGIQTQQVSANFSITSTARIYANGA